MKNLIVSIITLLILSFGTASAQDCNIYFPTKKGAVREMTSYDKKDNPTSKVYQEVVDVQKDASGVEITVKTKIIGEEDAVMSESEVAVGCKDGVFKVDMSEYVSSMVEAYQSMEIEFSGEDLSFPSKMKVGDILPEGSMNIKIINNGVTFMTMDVVISNRKVEAIEDVKTPAGTYKCYKISYETVSKTKILTIRSSSIEWLSEEAGVVKTESYNKKGKMTGYSLLTKYED